MKTGEKVVNLGDEVIIKKDALEYWNKQSFGDLWVYAGGDKVNILCYNQRQDEAGLGHPQKNVNMSPFPTLEIGSGRGYWWFVRSAIKEVVGQKPLDITECL